MPRYEYQAEVIDQVDGVIEAPNKKAAIKKAKELAQEQGCWVSSCEVSLIKKADYDCYAEPE